MNMIMCISICALYTHTHTLTHAHSDKIKDAVIAKIAMQASDLYADAYSNMLVGSVKQQWDKVWLKIEELHKPSYPL